MNLADIYVKAERFVTQRKESNPPPPSMDISPEPGVVLSPDGKGFMPPADLPRFPSNSLEAARKYVFGNLMEGSSCPCCSQHVQLRGRTITKGMSKWLCSLVSLFVQEERFYHVHEISSQGGGDYAKLLKWGLIETMVNTDPTKRTSGMFRPTKLGIEFTRGIAKVPSHVFVFNNKVWGKKLTQMRIADVKRFNWQTFKTAVFGR